MEHLGLVFFVVACFWSSAKASYDPETTMTTLQIISRWGYTAEEHNVVTDDNYILEMHRIPYGKDGPSRDRPVVFLQHGLEDSSVSWVINLPEQSAGFIFADAGFDVWIGNMRGNAYSRDHLKYDVKSHEFWRFSFDEMAQYDLSAQINYVLKRTNQSSLYYIGHSQGTLTMFAKLSEDQAFASKIKKFFALAPVGTVKDIKGAFGVIARYLYSEIEFFYWMFGDGEFLPSSTLLELIAKYVCGSLPGGLFCDNLMMLIMGVDSNQLNATRTPVYIAHIPSGTSTLNTMHWIQMVRSGLVQKYDFGSNSANKKHYGQTTPPLYDLSKITAKMYLYWSPDDWIADEKDFTDYLLPTLPKEYVKNVTKLDSFNHVDFLWGQRAATEVYSPILAEIQKDLKPGN